MMTRRAEARAGAAGVTYGVSWGDQKPGRLFAAVLLSALTLVASLALPPAASADGAAVRVIVMERRGAGLGPEGAVVRLGGRVARPLPLIGGFAASLPAGALEALASVPGVSAVHPDGRIRLSTTTRDAREDGGEQASRGLADPEGSLRTLTRIVGARAMWRAGYTGKGVDVALIDTGVVPLPGLPRAKIVNGPDLSFDSQDPALRHLDSYGHGTHLAGIIAGRDDAVVAGREDESRRDFLGVAPGARIVNVKVGATNGVTDVSQVIAAIDWVVQHRSRAGLNIRVVNLSFGTDGTQSYRLDPLAHAAEVAWRKGLVVVASAGNAGFGDARLDNPALDPYLIAVGASDTAGTYPANDDTVPEWSSKGDGTRNPDLVAPGVSVVSLRDPGSMLDEEHPSARVDERFFRGSGTSQAAAVVSGAAALLLEQRPHLTPDRVKALLTSTAWPLPGADPVAQGSGELDLRTAMRTPAPDAVQTWSVSTGTGSLQLARGSGSVVDPDGFALEGEMDIFGAPWDAEAWSRAAWDETSWSGGLWNGGLWAGDSWTQGSWDGMRWGAVTWDRASWSGMRWGGMRWGSMTWDGMRWGGMRWGGMRWGGMRWGGASWD